MRALRAPMLLVTSALIASALVAPAAATGSEGSGAALPASESATVVAGDACRRDVGVAGFATIGGERIRGAKVRIFARAAEDERGTFSKRMRVQGSARTNDMGGYFVSVDCLPKVFVVKISDGRIGSRRQHQTITALGRSTERGVIVTPVTSVAVALAQTKQLRASVAVKRTKKYLKLVDLGREITSLGTATWVRSVTFSPVRFLAAAMKAGGVSAFAKRIARDVSASSHRSFRPKGYVKSARPGFPRSGADGSPRTNVKQQRSGVPRGGPSSVLYSVAGKAAFDTTCALLPPSPPTNMACASPGSSQDAEIENQLTAISTQLTALQQSVNDIISTLAVMETQLNEIQDTLNEIVAQNDNSLQVQLQSAAETAQQQYQDAYGYADVTQIQSIVQDATYDLSILGTITPSTTWAPVAPGSSNQTMCATMYSDVNLSTGQNPLALCADFLTQVQAFASPSTAFFQTLYQSLVGASGLPQDDLLVWTYQQMLTFGGNAPTSSETLAQIQSSAGQLGALMDNAYALLAAGQIFEYGATTGLQTACTELTTSGTFPSSTPITVSDSCSTLETGLFTAAVQNAQGASVAVPPAGSVADPRTNYVWWSYPVDLTASTGSSGGFPFWPGAPAGTYTTATGSPLQLWAYTNAYNPACCNSNWLYATGNTGNPYPPLLASSPSYNFMLADQAQNQTLFNNLLLTNTSSIAATLQQSGFEGIGEQQYGMQWTNLGVDPEVTAFATTLNWQSSTQMASNTAACTGFPPRQQGTFNCFAEQTYDWMEASYVPVPGESGINAIMASQTWNLEGTQLPNASTLITCPTIGSVTPYGSTAVNPVAACWTDTFGLLVDTAAGSGGTGVLPPFWAASMFAGPSPSGVPAVSVPAPTPVVASS